MSLNSHIEWTDATWNPVRGCVKISPGCKHCYAETFAERFPGGQRTSLRAGIRSALSAGEAAGAIYLSVEPLLEDLGEIDLSGITWVIVGGESGPGARPMKREWVVSIRKQCRAQGVPFFFKQWGGVRKAKNGRLLDGRTYDEYPNRVIGQVPDRGDCMKRAADFIASFSATLREPLVQITA